MGRVSIVRTLMFALTLAAIPAAARAQLAPSDAAEFIGVWTVTLDSPQGSFEQEVTVKAAGDKVVATITNQMQPAAQDVTDVSKEGKDLVLKFAGDFQGNAFDAKIVMSPTGDDKASVLFDINGGQFSMSGAGTRKR
jgi:hypothetical protein